MATAAADRAERQARKEIPIRLSSRRERSDQYHRDQFIGAFTATEARADRGLTGGWPVHVLVEIAAALLAAARGFHRLQEQQCNGEGYYDTRHDPRDNGVAYVPCPVCGDEVPQGAMVGSARYNGRPASAPEQDDRPDVRRKCRQCVDCRQRERIRQLLPEGWRVRFQGDPRGCVVYIAYAVPGWTWDSSHDQWLLDDSRAQTEMQIQPRWLGVW